MRMDYILLGELGLGCGSFGPGIRKEEFSDISRNGLLASCYNMVGGEELERRGQRWTMICVHCLLMNNPE